VKHVTQTFTGTYFHTAQLQKTDCKVNKMDLVAHHVILKDLGHS